MNKKIVFLSLIAIIILGSYFLIPQKQVVIDLAMDNVEALAGGENFNIDCEGVGSLDCMGRKSAIIYSPYSLRPQK